MITGFWRLSKKWLCHFFEKASLRSAPLLSADSGQFDAHSAQSVFCHAHVAAENELYCFRVCGRETLRGFFRQAEKACDLNDHRLLVLYGGSNGINARRGA